MRRHLQFSLRGLLVAFTVACVWLGHVVQSAREQHEAVRQINAMGGSVGHDGFSFQGKPYQWPGRGLAAEWFGDYHVFNVIAVRFKPDRETFQRKHSLPQYSGPPPDTDGPAVTDETLSIVLRLPKLTHLDLTRTDIGDLGLQHVCGLHKLQRLWLMETLVTDAGLEHLKHLHALEELDLSYTEVTKAGVAELQRSLPNCKIEHKDKSEMWWARLMNGNR